MRLPAIRHFARPLDRLDEFAALLAFGEAVAEPGLLPQIQLRRTDRELRLIVPAGAKGSLGDVTARRLESAAEAFDLKSTIVKA